MISIAQCFGIGMVVGCWAGLMQQPLVIALAIASVAAAITHSDLSWRALTRAILVACVVTGLGLWRVTLIPYSLHLSSHQTVGIDAITRVSQQGWRASATTLSDENNAPVQSGYRIILSSRTTPPPQAGQIIRVVGTWQGHIPVTNPGQRDFQAWQQAQRISRQLMVTQWDPTSVQPSVISQACTSLRAHWISCIQRALPDPHASVIAAIMLGDSGISISSEIKRHFKRAGLTHLLVVSGSQVSLVLGIGIGTLAALRMGRAAQLGFGTVLNILVYGVSGGGVSILRAVLMSQVMITARWIRQSPDHLDLLWVTIGLMGCYDPTTVIHPGTLLSFAATAGLGIGVPRLANRLPVHWSNSVKTGISVAVVPTLVTSPIVAVLSHTASPISILANFIAIPLVEVSVVVGLISTFMTSIGVPVLGEWGLWGAFAVVSALIKVAELASTVSWATVGISGQWEMIPLAVLGLVALWLVPEQVPNYRVKSIIVIGLLVLIGISAVRIIQTPAPFRVVMLDVGQGDATLIQSQGGQTVLIDTGKPGMGDQVITPALRYYGITTLDTLIITHFDDDHVGGAAEIIAEFSPREIITNGRGIVTSRDIVAPHDRIIRLNGGGHIRLMYPNPPNLSDDNNHSICAIVQWQDMSWLITGDLEAEGETALIHQFGQDLRTRVLKLGHHGSKTSTTPAFLTITQPSLAIASAGRKNRYGHPHPTVLNRLARHGVSVLRTDQDGAIEFNGASIVTWANRPVSTRKWYER